MKEENKLLALSAVSQRQSDLIKKTFKDNDYLLKVMRNMFFGFDTSLADKKLISHTFSSDKELRDVVRKKIFPIFSDTIDLETGLAADYWLDIEKEILGAHSTQIHQKIMSKQKCFDMLTSAMSLLENPNGTAMDLMYVPNLMADEWQVNLLGRSLYIRTIGQGLFILKMIANQKDESPKEEEIKKGKNSSK